MSDGYKISVVIPTYQRRDSVARALGALTAQTFSPADYEVVVAIDGSQDGTRELLAGLATPYALRGLWGPNRGRAAACNAGIRAAQGELIVLLDDDMEPTPELLAAHWRAHAGATRLAVVGAVPITVDAATPPVVAYVGTKFNRHLARLSQPDHQFRLRDFYSGNCSIRREVLLEVGLFDEAFKIYGNEDVELSLRLKRAGVPIVYDAAASAVQHYTKGFRALARDTVAKGKTAMLLAEKHAGALVELKLNTYHHGSRKWRALRAALLALSGAWPATPDMVAGLVERLERLWPARMELCYTLALDYYFWLGARAALRARAAGERAAAPRATGRAS